MSVDALEMLLQWWETSNEEHFIENALSVLTESKLHLISDRDGQSLPELFWWVHSFVDDDHAQKPRLLAAIENRLVDIFEDGMSADELVAVVESVQEFMSETVPEQVEEILDSTVEYEFAQTSDAIGYMDSEDSLSEHLGYLDSLAKLTGRDPEHAKLIVSERLAQFEEPDHGEYGTGFSPSRSQSHEEFDDEALQSLFSNLLRS